MSQSTIVPRRSSPCCIGCILGIVVVLCFGAAMGIYVYRFAKNNVTIFEVMSKNDPPLDTPGEVLMPAVVGDFERISLSDSLEGVAGVEDLDTSGGVVAVYEDADRNRMTVVGLSTKEAEASRPTGIGPTMIGQEGVSEHGQAWSIKIPFSDHGVITTWARPNWMFMVQTTSSLTGRFVEAFNPGESDGGAAVETPAATDGVTTDSVPVAETVVEDGLTTQ